MQNTLDKLLALDFSELDWQSGSSVSLENLNISASDAAYLIAIAKGEHLVGLDHNGAADAYYDAPIHAYRLLAELSNPDHIPVFFELMVEYNDMPGMELFFEDIPEILAPHGELAIAPTIEMLHNQDYDERLRIYCPEILTAIAKKHIDTRSTIIRESTEYLTQNHFTRKLNAFLISLLIDLNATQEIDVIRACHQAHLADITINGDLESVEIALGVRETRTTSEPNIHDFEQSEYHLARKALLEPLEEDASIYARFFYLFELYRRDCSLPSILDIEAFIIGILISPRFIPPSEYHPLIWDTSKKRERYTPVWENQEDATFFMQVLMILHNNLVEDLDTAKLELPVINFSRIEERKALISWLLYFTHGIGHWHKVSDPENLEPDIAEIISLSASMMSEAATSNKSAPSKKFITQSDRLKALLPEMYKKNKARGMRANPYSANFGFGGAAYAPQIRDTPKFSRNAPCPCGSGKKYKRCCMR